MIEVPVYLYEINAYQLPYYSSMDKYEKKDDQAYSRWVLEKVVSNQLTRTNISHKSRFVI